MTYCGIQNGRERVLHVKWENIPEVRVWFVHCRDALMQILVRLDRDKNSSIGTAGALVASEKRRTVGLCFLFVCYEGYQSDLQVRGELRWDLFIFEETYGRTFCQKDYQSSLWVRRDLQSDLFHFLFVIQSANTWFKKKRILLQEDTTPFPGLLHFTLDMYLILLSVK